MHDDDLCGNKHDTPNHDTLLSPAIAIDGNFDTAPSCAVERIEGDGRVFLRPPSPIMIVQDMEQDVEIYSDTELLENESGKSSNSLSQFLTETRIC